MAKHDAQILLFFMLLMSAVGCYCAFSKQLPHEEGLSKLKTISRNLKGNVFSTYNGSEPETLDESDETLEESDYSDHESAWNDDISINESDLNDVISNNEYGSGDDISDNEYASSDNISDTETIYLDHDRVSKTVYAYINSLRKSCESIDWETVDDPACSITNEDNRPICSPCNVDAQKCTYIPPPIPPRLVRGG